MGFATERQRSLERHLKRALPLHSPLRRLLRRLKTDLNELLWTVKPDWPQIAESPEVNQLRQIMKSSQQAPTATEGRRVLVFSMRSWRIHKIWDGLIARGLLERGASPSVLICDGLPRCDMFQREAPANAAERCQACLSYTKLVFQLFGLPVRSVSEYLQPQDYTEARALVAGWPSDYPTFIADGLPLGELVRPSLMRTVLGGSLQRDAVTMQLYREYLEGSILLARVFRRVLASDEPDTLMLLNGMFFAERTGMFIAQEAHVHTVTYERGFMRNRLVLAHDEPANLFRVDAAWPDFSERPLSPANQAELDGYLHCRQTGKNEVVSYWPSVEAREDYIVRQLGLDGRKAILTAFTNILWDTAVYERDVGFAGMFDWLETTIRAVGMEDELQLVIRIHPAEVRLRQKTRERVLDRLSEAFATFPDNVVIVPPESDISSYALIDLSTAVAVYTSTVGLEAVLRGVPVLVSGQTHYRGKGFTHDVQSPAHYGALLREIPSWQRCTDEQISRANRYAYLFFLRNMLPMDLVTEFEDGSVRFNFESFDALQPGRSAILDHICSGILQKRSFVLP